MAQIDQLIGMMTQRHAERVMLLNDQPMQMFVGGVQSAGSVVPGAALQNILNEITPPHLRSHLSQDGGFSFPYQSPHGAFDIKVGRNGANTQVAILPHTNGSESSNGAPMTSEAAPPPTQAVAPVRAKAAQGTREIQHMDELFRFMKEV